MTLAVVFHEREFPGQPQDEILVAVVIEIDEEGAAAEVEDIDAGLGRGIAGRAIRLMDEEPIGKAAGLEQVKVVEFVAIDIAHDDPLGPQEICNQALVRACAPVIETLCQLLAVARGSRQDCRSCVGELDPAGLSRADLAVAGDPHGAQAGGHLGRPFAVPGGSDLPPTIGSFPAHFEEHPG